MKMIYMLPIMMLALLGMNVFAIDSIDDYNPFYTVPSEIEVDANEEFVFIVANETKYDLKVKYKSDFCQIQIEDVIPSETKIEVPSICSQTDSIVFKAKALNSKKLFLTDNSKKEYLTKINIIVKENPIIPEPEPEVPSSGGGRSLNKEGIDKYGKENFYMILDKIKEYKEIAKMEDVEFKLFYWVNSRTVDFTYKTNSDYNQISYMPYESIKLE
jgi:hypothetical protein